MERDRYLRDYENLRKRSMSGSSAERRRDRERRRTIRIQKEEKMRKIRNTILAVSFATLVAASPALIHDFVNTRIMDSLTYDFKSEIIAPETHRTDDGLHYFYDYDDIAGQLSNFNDIDEGVYLLLANIGEYQTNIVLENTTYKNIEDFLKIRGYETIEDFKRETKQRIIDKTTKQVELTDLLKEEIKVEQNHEKRGIL